jgi:phage tail tape-measure protein
VANANKVNSTVYFFFGVFLGGTGASGTFKIGEVVKPKQKPAAKPKKAVKPKAAKPKKAKTPKKTAAKSSSCS